MTRWVAPGVAFRGPLDAMGENRGFRANRNKFAYAFAKQDSPDAATVYQ